MAQQIDNQYTRITIQAVAIAILVPLVLYIYSIAFSGGHQNHGPIENIHGIPYPQFQAASIVTEELAHSDIYLTGPVAFKNISLAITFDPGSVDSLAVGIRQDPFWLSYGDKVEIYNRDNTQPSSPHPQTKIVTIPLADKLQSPDRSLDLMFFASGKQINWQLIGLEADTSTAIPTWAEAKDYLKSIINRERPL